jgi:hypothetical protein
MLMSSKSENPTAAKQHELVVGQAYLAAVNNTTQYGVFINLTPESTTDVTGLVHTSKLPPMTKPNEFPPGERAVVQFLGRKDGDKLSFEMLYSESGGSTVGPIPDVDPTEVNRPAKMRTFNADGEILPDDDSDESEAVVDDGILDDVAALSDEVRDLADMVAEHDDALDALADDAADSDSSGLLPEIPTSKRLTDDALDLIATVADLRREGYHVTNYDQSSDGGEITITATLNPDDADTTDQSEQ